MNRTHSMQEKEMESRAADALRGLLRQVSAIKIRDLKLEPGDSAGRAIDILAYVGVYGQSHTLACKVATSSQPGHVRKALRELCNGAAQLAEAVTPVFIAPYLPPEAQALCAEAKTGFLDFEDNARLVLGEVFIGKRSIGHRNAAGAVHPPAQRVESGAFRKFPPAPTKAPLTACQTAA